MPKPIQVDLPYPTTDGICADALSLRIVSPAYASPESELNTILQYIYHSFNFSKQGYKDVAETLVGIAVAEMHHLEILGGLILVLGAQPVYAQYPSSGFNFYSAKYVAYSRSLKNMLEDAIIGEKHAISGYERMLKCLKNEQVKAIISRILQDEKLHLQVLESILNKFNS